jgi:spatacsin
LRNYTDIERPELDDLELLKYLIAVSSQNNDALSFAKELISLNKINDEDIASIICKETLIALKSSLSESSSSESSISSSEVMSASFLSLVRLLNDTIILGIKLLNTSESEDLLNDPINKALLTELYIKAHECFSLSCDVKGIALVLRKSRLLITQNLLQSQDFNLILRLMTGIGRYSEMTYCFDILKESNQFELLLSKRIEKVLIFNSNNTSDNLLTITLSTFRKAPQLRIALLDYLKEDKDMYPLVALRFCLYREIAESHESYATKLLNDIKFLLPTNIISYREQLETIMFEYIDAHESYCKAGSHSHADSCAKRAQLISLQIHYLPINLVIINLKDSQITQFIENHTNFYEV